MIHRFSVSLRACLLAGSLILRSCPAVLAAEPAAAPNGADATIALIEGQPAQAPHPPQVTEPASIALPATPAGSATPTPNPVEELAEIKIEAPDPVYVAPTLRDRIGRIWAPVTIDGKGPFRLVLDTGASRSALTAHVAQRLGRSSETPEVMLLHGVTGSATVPAVKVSQMEVGELLINSTTLPIVADAFGGAEGVLGREGLFDKRIFADFVADRLVISRSHGQRAPPGFTTIPLKFIHGGLLAADVRIGRVRAKAIIDTGGQQTVGNLALRDALMRRPPVDSPLENIIGVTLESQRGTNVAIPPISMNGVNITQAHVVFGDMALFQHWKLEDQPTILIGMDVLGLFDTLIIDYKLREMQVRMRDAPRPRLHFGSPGDARNNSF